MEVTEPVEGPLRRPTSQSLRLLASLATALSNRIEEITDRTVEAICEREDGYREGRLVPMEELRRSVHDSLAEYLGVLTHLPGGRSRPETRHGLSGAAGPSSECRWKVSFAPIASAAA